MRKTLVVASLLSALSAMQVAHAQAAKPAPSYTITGNMTLASEYIFRGIGQTNRKPAIQGGVDYAHASGFYAGLWASNISILSDATLGVSAAIEADFYGGYKGSYKDVSYDIGALQYYYPGNYPASYVSPDTLELYAQAGWRWFTLKYSHAVSNTFGFADSKASHYLDLTGNFELGHGVTLSAHVGHQKIHNNSAASYTDWKLGVSKEYVGLNWGLAYVDPNAKGDAGEPYANTFGKDLGKARGVLTVGKTF
jgi:uncharacterized protein (TIGR02001 family)